MVGAWPLLIGAGGGLSVHLHPFLPRSLLPCLALWGGGDESETHLRSISVGFCFLCSSVELYAVAGQVTNSPYPWCCRWRWFPPRRDCRSSSPPDISCVALPQGRTAAVWSSIHVAGKHGSSIGTIVKVMPEGPSPPAHSQQSCQVIAEPSLRSFLQVRRREGRWQAELSNALSQPQGTDTALSDTHIVQYVAQSPKLASRSGNGVDTSKRQRKRLVSWDAHLIRPGGVLHRHSRSTSPTLKCAS